MYEYYAIEKQEIFCMLSMLPLRLAVERVNMLLRMFNRLSADEVWKDVHAWIDQVKTL